MAKLRNIYLICLLVPMSISLTGPFSTGANGWRYNRAGAENISALKIDPTQAWNTFLGSNDADYVDGFAVDRNGNIYIAGSCSDTWGSPVNAYAGGYYDAFAAKLDSHGTLLWNTFLGGDASSDWGSGIAVDGSGNVYITGYSAASWGSPVNAFAGWTDAFVAKFNSSGVRQWNTFLGATSRDESEDIAADKDGNVFVLGYSSVTWGSPVNTYSGETDAFAAKLNNSGVLQWNSFMGSANYDIAYGIAVDKNGNVDVSGRSNSTWGSPVNAFTGGWEVFVARLNSTGMLQWNTFMGSEANDDTDDIAVDGSDTIYISGQSQTTWGTPVNAEAGGWDAFAAKLNGDGVLQWNTFMGAASDDYSTGVAMDRSDNVYLAGRSSASWGSPVIAHAGGDDAFAAKLNSSGVLQWNSFMGSTDYDIAYGIGLDDSRNVYVSGLSSATWRTPVSSYAGGTYDVFVAKLDSGISNYYLPLIMRQ